MATRQTKNWNWNIPVSAKREVSKSDAHLSVFMDIRDELQELNRDISKVLRSIHRKIPTRRKRK